MQCQVPGQRLATAVEYAVAANHLVNGCTKERRATLRRQWRKSAPYPHLVIDDAISAEQLETLATAVAAEPHWPLVDEITTAMASAPSPVHPELKAFAELLAAGPLRQQLEEICGAPLGGLLLRSYVYLPGASLLPHADYRRGLGRALALIIYLRADPAGGGELLLYPPSDGDGPTDEATQPAAFIKAKPGRMVVMQVGPDSVHEVAEVTAGARVSLAGWFYTPGVDPLGTAAQPPPTPAHTLTSLSAPRLVSEELCDAAREATANQTWESTTAPTLGRFESAALDCRADAIRSLLSLVRDRSGADLSPLSARLLRTKPGGYALSKGLERLRPSGCTATIVLVLNEAVQQAGGEWVWHGAHGPVAMQSLEPGTISVMHHGAALAAYVRPLTPGSSARHALRLVIWCSGAPLP
jgi:hypothetical protein